LNEYVVARLSADVEARRVELAGSTTTSTPSTSTSAAPTTTMAAPTTTTVASGTTAPPFQSTTTQHLASGTGGPAGSGWVSGAIVAVATLGGLLVWRQRRLARGANGSEEG
jgi:hypothetical protein